MPGICPYRSLPIIATETCIMKKITCLLSVLFSICAYTQSNKLIDSLEKVAASQKDTSLVITYNELTWQYRNVNRDKAIEYGNKALELGLKLKFDKGVAQAYNDMGIIYYDQEDFEKALDLYNRAFEIRKKQGDQKGMAALYNKIGILFQRRGDFDKALDNQQKALTLYEKIQNDIGISYSINNIGIIHQNMGNYEEALTYQERSIAIKEKLGDKYGLAGSYVNAGNIWLIKKNYPKTEEYYSKAEEMTRAIGDKEYLSNALNNFGSYFLKTNQLSKALQYVTESFQLRQALQDHKGMVSCMANLGDIYTRLQQYDSAQAILQKAVTMADSSAASRPELPKLYKQFASLYEAKGDLGNALAMQRKYSELNDSLYTDDLRANFAELQTKYETAKKEQTIQQQQFELTKKNFWIAAVTGILLLGALLAFSFYKRYRLQQEKKLQLEIMHQQDMATRAIIEAEENERSRIASDLHDGVGQMMSAAKMNLSGFESRLRFDNEKDKVAFENIISLVDESCKEVRSVSHNMMPNALLKNGLSNAVKEFISKIDHSVLKVNLYTEGLNERLESDTETVLYRVIQECVNNVIKHSGANTLDISLIKDADGIAATIDDNGKGFDTNAKEKFEGIGLKNIVTRLQYLKGTVDFDSAPGKGTLVAIHVPL
jgi:signal transduction histidine kinase